MRFDNLDQQQSVRRMGQRGGRPGVGLGHARPITVPLLRSEHPLKQLSIAAVQGQVWLDRG